MGTPLGTKSKYMLYELWAKFRLRGTYRGLYGVLGGPIKGYTINLVPGSYAFRDRLS